jgi:transposase
MPHVVSIGLDIAKNVFHVHGIDETGTPVVVRKLSRSQLVPYFRDASPCLVGIEASGAAHHWARTLGALGHTVKIMPAGYVRPYVKTNKSDRNDAEAICEAVGRPTMRFVPVKNEQQQAVLILHKTRDLLTRQRTMVTNAIRGHLAEFGLVAPPGPAGVSRLISFIDASARESVPVVARAALRILVEQVRSLSTRIKSCEERILRWHHKNPQSKRLATIPGVGPLTASALVASIGDASLFRSGRQLAAFIGLVPRQRSTGGRPRLEGISKRGNAYLRTLLFMGARSMFAARRHARSRLGRWLTSLRSRKPGRVAAIALANKMARIAWALLRHNEDFRQQPAA